MPDNDFFSIQLPDNDFFNSIQILQSPHAKTIPPIQKAGKLTYPPNYVTKWDPSKMQCNYSNQTKQTKKIITKNLA